MILVSLHNDTIKSLMIESLPFLISGIVLGFVAGISPGPLLTLVISETLKHNKKEGILVASAPLITDIPIVLLSIFILVKLSHFHYVLGVISFCGALVKGLDINLQSIKARSLRKAIITNFLSPHPYLFWIAVGAPTVLKGYKINILSALLFITGFYLLLVGSKITAALIVDKSKAFFKSKAYLAIIRTLGFILLLFCLIFIKDGLTYFGFI
jgi:threonine/homoserine/homoserine lactone efflux protein